MDLQPFTSTDVATVRDQLGREPRAVAGVAWRCPCGRPGVIATEPRLPNGSPFPTTYYLTCPRAASLIGRLEASGLMAQMTERLAEDPELAEAYQAAHERYLADRTQIAAEQGTGPVAQIEGISAGGMPTRVKCLHALAAQALASGPGVNPLGDEVVAELGRFWTNPCHPEHVEPERPAVPQNPDDSDDSEHSDDSGRPGSSEPRHRPEPPVPHEPGSSRNLATPPANPPEHHESEAS